MAEVGCRQTNAGSFSDNLPLDQRVAKDYFLRKLNEVID